MNAKYLTILVISGAITFSICFGIGVTISTLDSEAKLKNAIIAQEDNREQAFDKLYKKIAQATQITKATNEQQVQLVQELVKGRPAGFVRVVNEMNPESLFTLEQFTQLMNMVEAERDFFFREQKLLISKVEVYNNKFDTVFSGTILKFFGREKYPRPVIITSDNAKDVRESGKDNDIDLNLDNKKAEK